MRRNFPRLSPQDLDTLFSLEQQQRWADEAYEARKLLSRQRAVTRAVLRRMPNRTRGLPLELADVISFLDTRWKPLGHLSQARKDAILMHVFYQTPFRLGEGALDARGGAVVSVYKDEEVYLRRVTNLSRQREITVGGVPIGETTLAGVLDAVEGPQPEDYGRDLEQSLEGGLATLTSELRSRGEELIDKTRKG